MKEYAFDVTLKAALRVRATSEEDARRMVAESIECNTANLGCWPDGEPIVAEVSIAPDTGINLFEIDGEPQ